MPLGQNFLVGNITTNAGNLAAPNKHHGLHQQNAGCDRPTENTVHVALIHLTAEIKKHDDEQDQHHDRPGVDHDLNSGHKGRIEHDIKDRQAEKGHDQGYATIDRVPACDHKKARYNGNQGNQIKEQDFHGKSLLSA